MLAPVIIVISNWLELGKSFGLKEKAPWLVETSMDVGMENWFVVYVNSIVLIDNLLTKVAC